MAKTANLVRKFSHLGAAWCARHIRPDARIVDEITITIAESDGKGPFRNVGEFAVQWLTFSRGASPCLKVHDDAWRALSLCPDLLQRMAEIDGQDVSAHAFATLLLELGFKDATPREMLAANGF